MCQGRDGLFGTSLSLDLTPGILVDGGEGCGDVIEFLLKMVWIAELVCLTDECVGDRLEDGWVVEGPVVMVGWRCWRWYA